MYLIRYEGGTDPICCVAYESVTNHRIREILAFGLK